MRTIKAAALTALSSTSLQAICKEATDADLRVLASAELGARMSVVALAQEVGAGRVRLEEALRTAYDAGKSAGTSLAQGTSATTAVATQGRGGDADRW